MLTGAEFLRRRRRRIRKRHRLRDQHRPGSGHLLAAPSRPSRFGRNPPSPQEHPPRGTAATPWKQAHFLLFLFKNLSTKS